MSKKEYTEKIIHLMLKNTSSIADFIDLGYDTKIFDDPYKFIVDCILEQYIEHSTCITLNILEHRSQQYFGPKECTRISLAYSLCQSSGARVEDFHLLVKKLYQEEKEKYFNNILTSFQNDKKNHGFDKAVFKMSLAIQDLSNQADNEGEKDFYENIDVLSSEYIKFIEDIKNGEVEDVPKIYTGIDEIDETMVTGLESGTLTLFCSDVGGFKSTIMLNIALNVWKAGFDVLHVPIEMDKSQMIKRALARETRIPMTTIFRDYKDMTDEQFQKIKDTHQEFSTRESKLFVMQIPKGTSVNKIRYRIEKEIDRFRPQVVIIDYIANVEPDKNRYGRNDLEIGDILKGLRQMGRDIGFAIISAAQLGRPILSKIRSGLNNENFQINSEDIRGSHEYSADADNIYAQIPHPSQPNELLYVFPVKCRNGSKVFSNGSNKAMLAVRPEIGLVKSLKIEAGKSFSEEFSEMADNIDNNLDIDIDIKNDDIVDPLEEIEKSIKDSSGNEDDVPW